jgi:hypothetical protein
MIAEPVRTTCPLDCPDTCALHVRVDGDGRVALAGDPAHPVTAGFMCSKVARFGRRLDHAERLLTPLAGSGAKGEGRFAPISWDEAIAEITGRLRQVADEHGGEAILPFHYGGSNGILADDSLDDLLFARLGASRLAKTICAAPATAWRRAMNGRMPGVAHEDYVHARAIVLWGANPKVSSIHLVPFLREAKRRGAFSRWSTRSATSRADEIDLHLPVRPGADLPLALAIARRWQRPAAARPSLPRPLDDRRRDAARPRRRRGRSSAPPPRAAFPPSDIARLADAWADASPAVVRMGWGMERNKNGGQAMAAVLALPALAGKYGVRGGGYTLSNRAWTKTDLAGGDRRGRLGHAHGQHDAPRRLAGSARRAADVGATHGGATGGNGRGEAEGGLAGRATSGDGAAGGPGGPRAAGGGNGGAGQGAVRLQRQPAGDRPRPGGGARRARPAGPLHRRLRAGDDRHRPLGGRGAAGDHLPRAVGDQGRATAATAWAASGRRWRRAARRAPTGTSSPPRPRPRLHRPRLRWDRATAFAEVAAASTGGGEALSAPTLGDGGWQRPAGRAACRCSWSTCSPPPRTARSAWRRRSWAPTPTATCRRARGGTRWR